MVWYQIVILIIISPIFILFYIESLLFIVYMIKDTIVDIKKIKEK